MWHPGFPLSLARFDPQHADSSSTHEKSSSQLQNSNVLHEFLNFLTLKKIYKLSYLPISEWMRRSEKEDAFGGQI